MRTWFQRALIFFAGIAIGVVATWGVLSVHNFMVDLRESMPRQIEQSIPSFEVAQLAARFCGKMDRPPKDSEELTQFAMRQAADELDLSKLSVLRFEAISNRTVVMIWQLAQPAEGAGTNTISWGETPNRATGSD